MTAVIQAPSIKTALNAFLTVHGGVLEAMGFDPLPRIRLEIVPQGTPFAAGKPLLVYQRLGTSDIRILRGTVGPLHSSRFQIRVVAKDSVERDVLAQTVDRSLKRDFRGEWGGVFIESVAKDSDSDSSNDADGGSERDWACVLRFTAWHRNNLEV